MAEVVTSASARPATIGATGAQVGDVRVAEPAQFRMVLMSFLAAGIGLVAGLIAYILYNLIGLFTNIAFYHRFVAEFMSARHNQLGLWVIPIPVSKVQTTELPKQPKLKKKNELESSLLEAIEEHGE